MVATKRETAIIDTAANVAALLFDKLKVFTI
jgi:hypothetical protein